MRMWEELDEEEQARTCGNDGGFTTWQGEHECRCMSAAEHPVRLDSGWHTCWCGSSWVSSVDIPSA